MHTKKTQYIFDMTIRLNLPWPNYESYFEIEFLHQKVGILISISKVEFCFYLSRISTSKVEFLLFKVEILLFEVKFLLR
jgi:hypothetical protein